MVHRARAGGASLPGRRIVGVVPAAVLTSHLPAAVSCRREAERALEERPALLGVACEGADGVEPLESGIRRDLGMDGQERLVARRDDRELVGEPLGIGKAQTAPVARSLDAFGLEARRPELERRSEPIRQTTVCTIPAPARPGEAPGYSKKVMSAPGLPFSSA